MHYLSHKDLMNYETLTHLSFSQHFIQSKLQYTYYGDTPKLSQTGSKAILIFNQGKQI